MINFKKNSDKSIRLHIIIAVILAVSITVAVLLFLIFKGEKISLYSYFILAISILTLGATIMMSVIIYKLGIIRENQKQVYNKVKAKAAILQSLRRTLSSIILYYDDYNDDLENEDLSYFFDLFSSDISLSLSDKNFQTLFKLVKKIRTFSDDVLYNGWFEASCGFSFVFKDWIGLLYCTDYRQYFSLIQNENEAFSEEIIELLSELSDNKMEFNYYSDVKSVEGDILFSYDKKMKYTTVNNIGELLLNGEIGFDESENIRIKNGYENSSTYEGYYKDFKFHGQGCRFNRSHQKLEEGVWEKGVLVKGTRYGCVIKISEDGKYADELFQFYDDWNSIGASDVLLDYVRENNSFEGIMIADEKVEDEKYINAIPFSDFISKQDEDSSFVQLLKSYI